MTPLELAASFIARTEAGFDNEHEWLNWRKKHAAEIAALPIALRNKVMISWGNASAKEFSKPVRE